MTRSPVSAESAAVAPAPRILPETDETTRPYWTSGASGQLRIAHCGACRRFIHPPPRVCPDCSGPITFEAVSGSGTVFTYTVAHQQFRPDVPTPFVVALIELDEQADLRVVANIVDCEPDAVTSGLRVSVRFEQHGEVFVPVFAPVD
ncbi:Zn-ribbon domain-containing OB-fold protein [Mycolicibacterium confluentis]|uniref:Zn-ribbon domain-containing OB-fold protein n=1 Tax=Mycolicibacterium confluentis TaxID=28047 RepID=UPI001F2C49E3|nr:OB-fold domain-containing protein [Mycolicibacterium confluentis]